MTDFERPSLRGLELLRQILQKPIKSDFEIARGITIIEESAVEITILKSMIENPIIEGVKRIGITGAPGVGKSTFLNKLISSEDFKDFKIAIVAIDPSSRITHGAVLGDRIRFSRNTESKEIFFRSMATRGAYGGLNTSIESVLLFLTNCEFSIIFVETVGVGQNEVQIAECVDYVIHIVDSNSGDEVQMEKAGIMEIGDVYFVNKRDDKIDDAFILNLKLFASNSNRTSRTKPEVVVGSAISGEGLDKITRQLNLIHQNESGKGGARIK